jgi:hypothetical protein
MGYKTGLVQKLKICAFWLFSPTRKNCLVMTCEFCGSSNIVQKAEDVQSFSDSRRRFKTYTADYVCMNCKASCVGLQRWSRFDEDFISSVRNSIEANSKNEEKASCKIAVHNRGIT